MSKGSKQPNLMCSVMDWTSNCSLSHTSENSSGGQKRGAGFSKCTVHTTTSMSGIEGEYNFLFWSPGSCKERRRAGAAKNPGCHTRTPILFGDHTSSIVIITGPQSYLRDDSVLSLNMDKKFMSTFMSTYASASTRDKD
jgi:hypothetical protein